MVNTTTNNTSKQTDCLQCKIIGTVTFTGVAIYAIHLRQTTPIHKKVDRLFLTCFAIGAAGIAAARFLIP